MSSGKRKKAGKDRSRVFETLVTPASLRGAAADRRAAGLAASKEAARLIAAQPQPTSHRREWSTLVVGSPFEASLPQSTLDAIWAAAARDGGTTHSADARTLPHLVRRAEREGLPYQVHAWPGVGYEFRLLLAAPPKKKR